MDSSKIIFFTKNFILITIAFFAISMHIMVTPSVTDMIFSENPTNKIFDYLFIISKKENSNICNSHCANNCNFETNTKESFVICLSKCNCKFEYVEEIIKDSIENNKKKTSFVKYFFLSGVIIFIISFVLKMGKILDHFKEKNCKIDKYATIENDYTELLIRK